MKSFIGYASVTMIILAYFLLSFNMLEKEALAYNLLNLLGGVGLGYRVYLDKNWPNFILEIVFVLIALKSIFIK